MCAKEQIIILHFFTERLEQIAQGRFLKKSYRAMSNGSDLLLGIKRGKVVKNCQNKVQTTHFVEWIAHFWRTAGVIQTRHSFVKSGESDSLFCKERREGFAQRCSFFKGEESKFSHGRSLRRAILSKRVKSERAKELIPNPGADRRTIGWFYFILFKNFIH